MKLISGTMRNLHGFMMTHRLDQAPRVDLLHRRDHNHRHHNHKVRTFSRRRCREHQLAEVHPRQPMQLSDLDQEKHLKIKPNQRKMRIGLQLKTGWRGGSATSCRRRLCATRTENRVLAIRQRLRRLHHWGPSHHSQVWNQFELETILEKIDISRCSFFQYVDWRTTWLPHDQWERLRMVEALPLHYHDHWVCQMQRISSDGGLSNADIGRWRHSGGRNSQQAQEAGEQDWAVHHWEALDGSMGWIGRTGEKQQISHLDGLDLSNEI